MTDRLKLLTKSVSLLRRYFAISFGRLPPSPGVYKQHDASTFIARLRVVVYPLLSNFVL
jgi:hypothetical protein